MNALRRLWNLVQLTALRWNANDGPLLAATMAYYAALSFFPLLLVLISSLGFALRFSKNAQDAQQQLLEMLADTTSQSLSDQVQSILDEVQLNASVGGPVGVATLVIGAMGVFSQLDTAFARIWGDHRHRAEGFWGIIRGVLLNRLRGFLVLTALGLLVLILFIVGLALTALQSRANQWSWGGVAGDLLQSGVVVVLNTLVFSLLYKIMPRVKISWLHAICGGVFAAAVWEIGRQLLAWLVLRSNYTAYGVVGAFMAVLVWVYYASNLIFLGAQLVQVMGNGDEAPKNSEQSAAKPTK